MSTDCQSAATGVAGKTVGVRLAEGTGVKKSRFWGQNVNYESPSGSRL